MVNYLLMWVGMYSINAFPILCILSKKYKNTKIKQAFKCVFPCFIFLYLFLFQYPKLYINIWMKPEPWCIWPLQCICFFSMLQTKYYKNACFNLEECAFKITALTGFFLVCFCFCISVFFIILSNSFIVLSHFWFIQAIIYNINTLPLWGAVGDLEL